MTVAKSPIRYPGGKQRALKTLDGYLPETLEEYREPFAGGACMAFHVAERYPGCRIWINDTHAPLVAFWRVLQNPRLCNQLVRKLHRLRWMVQDDEIARHMFNITRDRLRKEDWTGRDVECAAAYYFWNRTSFSGAATAGFSVLACGRFRAGKQRIDDLKSWSKQMAGWKITCEDYEMVLGSPWISEHAVAYCDPPYEIARNNLYQNHDAFDHQRFEAVASRCEGQLVISYNQEFAATFQDWSLCKTFDLSYSMNSSADYRKDQSQRRELVIANFTDGLKRAPRQDDGGSSVYGTAARGDVQAAFAAASPSPRLDDQIISKPNRACRYSSHDAGANPLQAPVLVEQEGDPGLLWADPRTKPDADRPADTFSHLGFTSGRTASSSKIIRSAISSSRSSRKRMSQVMPCSAMSASAPPGHCGSGGP